MELMMNEEDEAFNEIERQAGQRKEAVRRSLSLEEARQQIQAMTQDRATLLSINPYRDFVIEEVTQHVEKLTGFGADTVSGLAIYIREMKQ
jgi:hypothetical protein